MKPRKSSEASVFLLARGEHPTNLPSLVSQEFSTTWLSPPLFYLVTHIQTILYLVSCDEAWYLLSLESSPYLGSYKDKISGETTFLLKTKALFVSPLLVRKFIKYITYKMASLAVTFI